MTRNPIRCRVCSDVDPDEVSAVEADDHEGVEQAKANGRDNDQIHRDNVRRLITQERSEFDWDFREVRDTLKRQNGPLEHHLLDPRRLPTFSLYAPIIAPEGHRASKGNSIS